MTGRCELGGAPSVLSPPMTVPDLDAAASAIDAAHGIVQTAIAHLAATGSVDDDQVLAYDLAHAASAVETGRAMLDYGAKGDIEARLTCAFIADAVADLAAKLFGREATWGADLGALDGTREFLAAHRDPEFLAALAGQAGPRHLDSDFEMVQDTFRRFADNEIKPVAEHIHRHNDDIPESIISGLAEMGGFAMSVPEEYGGFATGSESDYMGMVVATEELSRGSLGAGGSLITRPEILTRALEAGGTEAQKQHWLPKLASAEAMAAVAVTEPDYGSDVANIKVTATKADGGWLINGVKTWCTFGARADVLMLLARTDPDRSKTHRGLTLFCVPKPRGDAHGFEFVQEAGAEGAAPGGAKMEGRPIDTIGYRGMHSYEIAFDNWFVADDNQVGGTEGLGRGFYYQMSGFENGRLQTAARAVGVMQAAYEEAVQYAEDRKVFGQPIAEYQLTKVKLARMAATIQAARQFAYVVAKLMAKGEGTLEASMVKAYVCRAAEWVTREAMQIHGGFGYAEEYPVSRYFVDARVLSIFEGADETLCLKVIARNLVANMSK
ncbi:MAG: acyl-CoA/acyl-ACP dehydrogenase [Acidimicrobiia bacterium]|nr:acyl-CoA/acyl-ACP dehydrogenase [Acidimicrobiia bacterium]